MYDKICMSSEREHMKNVHLLMKNQHMCEFSTKRFFESPIEYWRPHKKQQIMHTEACGDFSVVRNISKCRQQFMSSCMHNRGKARLFFTWDKHFIHPPPHLPVASTSFSTPPLIPPSFFLLCPSLEWCPLFHHTWGMPPPPVSPLMHSYIRHPA